MRLLKYYHVYKYKMEREQKFQLGRVKSKYIIQDILSIAFDKNRVYKYLHRKSPSFPLYTFFVDFIQQRGILLERKWEIN
ncbi:hypothetical protein FGO68_gene17220 [Halteria grandinella]|uniref:Uncharacterized protein n=1 Tax=Halteria grandinella TaxID=5974 RepID=A0A8J8NJK8_HALGN|nr:hypothetical protein FGO68_gene17220 [Halteria grandinella]